MSDEGTRGSLILAEGNVDEQDEMLVSAKTIGTRKLVGDVVLVKRRPWALEWNATRQRLPAW